MAKKWKFKETEGYADIYEDSKGDIKVVYPKAPKWAADVAYKIWHDAEYGGLPTRKGVKECVRGLWGTMIAEAAKSNFSRKHN